MVGDVLYSVLPRMSFMAGGLSSGYVGLAKATQNLRVKAHSLNQPYKSVLRRLDVGDEKTPRRRNLRLVKKANQRSDWPEGS